VLTSLNRILHERGLEEYYCTLCYAIFDLKRRIVTFANSGLPFPVRVSGDSAAQIDLAGLPLGSFGASTYDEVSFDLSAGDVFVFCSDGISETFNEVGEEFGSARVVATAHENKDKPAKEIVGAIFGAMQAFRGHAPQTDDQTVVVVKITT
jgi:sigma-B regulation protein RsbU (phosphoserine phosphatase)